MVINPGPRPPVSAVCRILCGCVLGIAGNLTLALSQYDILLSSGTLVPDIRHVSELLVPEFGRPVSLSRSKLPRAQRMAAYVRDGYGAFRQLKFECGCGKILVFRVRGVRLNFHVFIYRRNDDQDDRIFDCFQTSVAAVPAVDVRASFLFMVILMPIIRSG